MGWEELYREKVREKWCEHNYSFMKFQKDFITSIQFVHFFYDEKVMSSALYLTDIRRHLSIKEVISNYKITVAMKIIARLWMKPRPANSLVSHPCGRAM